MFIWSELLRIYAVRNFHKEEPVVRHENQLTLVVGTCKKSFSDVSRGYRKEALCCLNLTYIRTTMLNLSFPVKVITKIENCSYFVLLKDRWESVYANFWMIYNVEANILGLWVKKFMFQNFELCRHKSDLYDGSICVILRLANF